MSLAFLIPVDQMLFPRVRGIWLVNTTVVRIYEYRHASLPKFNHSKDGMGHMSMRSRIMFMLCGVLYVDCAVLYKLLPGYSCPRAACTSIATT